MSVRDTSLLALESVRLEPDESKVLSVLEEIGPACDLRIREALNQQEQAAMKPKRQKRKWNINSVTGRRNSLVGKYELVEDLGTYRKPGHRAVHLWRVRGDTRCPEDFGWEKVEVLKKALDLQQRREQHERAEQVKTEAGKGVLRRLMEYKPADRRKTTQPSGQGLLFA